MVSTDALYKCLCNLPMVMPPELECVTLSETCCFARNSDSSWTKPGICYDGSQQAALQSMRQKSNIHSNTLALQQQTCNHKYATITSMQSCCTQLTNPVVPCWMPPNAHVLGPVRFQPPSLKGNVIAWSKKPGLTGTRLLHCAAAATISPTSAPTTNRHCASFSYNFEARKRREKK